MVQRLLAQAGVSPGPVDGRCGRHTMQAIERFQAPFLRRPDGRVDVAGPTWRHLDRVAAESSIRATPAVHVRPVHHTAPVARPATMPNRQAIHPIVRPSTPAARVRTPPAPPLSAQPQPATERGRHYWSEFTPLASPGSVNRGLACPSSRQMEELFGDPHAAHTQSRMKRGMFGSQPINGLALAIDSLNAIQTRVKQDLPDLHAMLGSAGMYALRSIRGHNCYSNHSWGTAIDVIVDGLLVALGATRSCKGLDALCGYFNEAGWYWGGGYHHRKDAMHFECGLSLARTFA